MPSRSLQTLAERLERRWRYVCEAEWSAIGLAMGEYQQFVEAQPVLLDLITKLQNSFSGSGGTLDAAIRRPISGEPWQPSLANFGGSAPAFGWALLLRAKVPYGRGALDWTGHVLVPLVDNAISNFNGGPSDTEVGRQAWQRDYLVQTYLRPLHEYLLDALDTNVETLAAMRWFQHWAQWFGASRFEWERRLEDEAVKAGKGKKEYEKRFQLVLFEKLFEYGLHLDLSREPNTAAGSPDFTVIQRTSTGPRPIVVEAKILDKATDPKAALGNLQIRRYMDVLHADTGYLVLFDMSVDGHHVELDHRLDDLPYLPVADGRQVYVIHAPIVSQTSASKADPAPLNIESFKFDLK